MFYIYFNQWMTLNVDSIGQFWTGDPSDKWPFGLVNCSPPQTHSMWGPNPLSVFSLNFRPFSLDPEWKILGTPLAHLYILLSRLHWQVICNVETMGHLQCDGCHRLTVADYFSKYWYFWPSNTKSNPKLNPIVNWTEYSTNHTNPN